MPSVICISCRRDLTTQLHVVPCKVRRTSVEALAELLIQKGAVS